MDIGGRHYGILQVGKQCREQFTARQYFQERLVCSALDWFCSQMTKICLLLCLLCLFLYFHSMFFQALFLSFKLFNHLLYHSIALACQH